MLKTHRAGKGPGDCVGGLGLRLKEQKGPRRAPPPLVSEGMGLHLGAQQASWARVGGANALISCPAPPLWGLGGAFPPASPDLLGLPPMSPRPMQLAGGDLEGRGPAWELSRFPVPKWVGQTPSTPLLLLLQGPSRLPLLISPASLLCPQDPRGLEGALDCRGLAWELSRLPGPQWVGQSPSAPLPLLLDSSSHLPLLVSLASLLCPQDPRSLDGALEWGELAWELSRLPSLSPLLLSRSSGESVPPASPDLPGLRDANPVWPPLLLPPQSPYVLPVHSGVPPVSLGIRVPHQRWQLP